VPDHDDVCHHLSRLPRQKSASRRGLRRRPPQRRPRQNIRRGHREPANAIASLFFGLFKIIGVYHIGSCVAAQPTVSKAYN
jgi:hypothetical protein